MPIPLGVLGYYTVMGGGAAIGGYMVGHAANNVLDKMHQDQSQPPPDAPPPAGSTSSPGDDSAAAGQSAKQQLAGNSGDCGTGSCPPPDKKSNKSRWSKGKASSPEENAEQHWEKHQGEFPEYSSSDDYVNGAHNFVDNPPEGTLTKPAPQGGNLMYDPASNTFASVDPAGNPRTMFRPTGGMSYWNAQ